MQLVVSTFFNAALLALFVVVFGAVFGRFHPIIDLFGQFLLPAIAGAALVALLAVVGARYATALLAVVALLSSLLVAWPWMQTADGRQANGTRFRLLVFNVYYYNPRLDMAARLVRDANADIVVLVEVIPRVRAQLDELVADYPYRVECWRERPCDALILSRFPLEDVTASLPEPKHRRPLGAVSVAIADRALTLFATHLSLPYPLEGRGSQTGEIQEIAETVNGVMGPRLLVGDFNAATWGATVARPRAFAALTALTGPGGTWPTFLPKHLSIPIDHVLASQELAFVSRQLITVYGSDHRAVLAEIAFKD